MDTSVLPRSENTKNKKTENIGLPLVNLSKVSKIYGIVGIGVGLGLAAVTAPALGKPFVFNLVIIVIAFLFSGLVGIIFGHGLSRYMQSHAK